MRPLPSNLRPGHLLPGLIASLIFVAATMATPDQHRYVSPSGWKVTAGLAATKASVLLGEPVWLTYEIENENKLDLYVRSSSMTTAGGRTPDFHLVVKDASTGKRLPLLDTGPIMGGFPDTSHIPPGQRHVRHLFLPLWANLDGPGRYIVSCSKTLMLQTKPDIAGKTEDVATSSRVEIEVLPPDEKAMGVVIDSLGQSMLGAAERAQRAIRSLQEIRDARVIPWWKRAIETGRRQLMYEAPRGLAPLTEAEALVLLRRLAKVDAKDIRDPLDEAHAPRAAAAIRSTTAGWLSLSAHPGAPAVLRAMHTDSEASVRLRVLGALDVHDADNLAIVRKMTRDPDKRVRSRARKVLDQMR